MNPRRQNEEDTETFDYRRRYRTNGGFGEWADKPGSTETRILTGTNGLDPASSVWDDYYNSDVVYYAIKDIRTINWP